MGLVCCSAQFFWEPVSRSGDVTADFLVGSGSEFEVGRAASCDEASSAAQTSPMHFASSLWQYLNCIWQSLGRSYLSDFLTGPVEFAVVCCGGCDISTEAETRSQTRRRHAIMNWCLLSLADSAHSPLHLAAVNGIGNFWRKHSTMICIVSIEDCSRDVPRRFLIFF